MGFCLDFNCSIRLMSGELMSSGFLSSGLMSSGFLSSGLLSSGFLSGFELQWWAYVHLLISGEFIP